MKSLPIDSAIPEILGHLAQATALVLKAEPGAGKTTRVPPSLLDADFVKGEVWVLEPRRLAAKYAALRVAEERGEAIGQSVGYHFRFENVAGPRTRLRFLTEGTLIRRLLTNPQLSGVAIVVLDEFHERSLHTDLALAYLRWLQTNARPDLKLVVMSATLDTAPLSAYFEGAPSVEVKGRTFPVESRFLPAPNTRAVEAQVASAVVDILRSGARDGHILVFLPGMGDIRRSADALERHRASLDFVILPLHGDLSREEQDQALKPLSRTKVILSTNVAETSLTIDGVTTVIDSGLHRMASYSWWSGVPQLSTRPISRASAHQRAGRAGRTQPGRAIRLYTQGDFESRPAFDIPEISRADLSQTVLELLAMGAPAVEKLPWFEPPVPSSIASSRELLFRLGAVDSMEPSGKLTELGRRLSRLPTHPRLARMLVESERTGSVDEALTLAALFSDGRWDRLDAEESVKAAPRDFALRRQRDQLKAALEAERTAIHKPSGTKQTGGLAYAVLMGFPDRVAKKRRIPGQATRGKLGEVELVLSSGGSALVEETGPFALSDTFVLLDLQEQKHGGTRSRLKVRSACSIDESWLFDVTPPGVRERDELIWDAERGRVVSRSLLTYDGITLDESQSPPRDRTAATKCLLKGALGIEPSRFSTLTVTDWLEAFRPIGDPKPMESTIARLLLLSKFAAAFRLPELTWETLRDAIPEHFEGELTLAALRAKDWSEVIVGAAGSGYASQLDRLTPEQIHLPSGRKLKIQYQLDKSPWVESRLQDFFGMKKGPSILSGQLPLTLHLLAPNYRAVQVTTDLSGFWERAYPPLRKELSRQYPRHSWPESPLTATPPVPKKR